MLLAALSGCLLACSPPPASPSSEARAPATVAVAPVASSPATPVLVASAPAPTASAPARRRPRVDQDAWTTPSGLIVHDVLVGKGATVAAGSTVEVLYVGTFLTGEEFDSTASRNNAPFRIKIGQGLVIKGWDEGLVGMKVGGKRQLTIPPELGYGARGAPPKIPPEATLIFEIELLSASP